jgi:V/A-type H+-transporting ATPase subunit I
MIVKMKKITLLTLNGHKDKTLKALRNIGVVHIKNVQPPKSADLDFIHQEKDACSTLINVLNDLKLKPDHEVELSAEKVIEEYQKLNESKTETLKELSGFEKQAQDILPLGDFDVSQIETLANKGLYTKLYSFYTSNMPEIPENVDAFLIASTKHALYYALVGENNDFQIEDYQPIDVPELSLSQIKKEIDKRVDAVYGIDLEIANLKPAVPILEDFLKTLETNEELLMVRDGMGDSETVSYLEGFVPEDQTEPLEKAAKHYGWGLVIDDAVVEDDVPTLIRSPKWVAPMKTVFSAIGIMPGYDEIDFSSVFLCFFSLFVGIIVGDAGYGLLFLAITMLLAKKMRKANPAALGLLLIMDFSTIIWGTITCNFFGISPDFMPAFLQEVKINWLANDNNMMKLCFLIGAIHLTIAHLWKICRTYNSVTCLGDLGWIGMTWTMYLAALSVVLGETGALPTWWILYVSVPSLLLAIVFMTTKERLKEDWPGFVIMPLTVINNFVDIVSYVRLYAVGTASLAIAQSFNDMAVIHGLPMIVTGLIAALILFAGHTLNILLASMGILVHGIRLNTLEFSGHIGVEWKGHAYKPFEEKNNLDKI